MIVSFPDFCCLSYFELRYTRLRREKVSIFRKHHNRALQTNSQHHEEESQNTNSHTTSERQLK